MERVAAYSDTDDSEDELLFLPVSLEPDARIASGKGAGAGEGNETKGRSAHVQQGGEAGRNRAENVEERGTGAQRADSADAKALEGAVDAGKGEEEEEEEAENGGEVHVVLPSSPLHL